MSRRPSAQGLATEHGRGRRFSAVARGHATAGSDSWRSGVTVLRFDGFLAGRTYGPGREGDRAARSVEGADQVAKGVVGRTHRHIRENPIEAGTELRAVAPARPISPPSGHDLRGRASSD